MTSLGSPLSPAAPGQPATVRVGLLGCGVVGSATARMLLDNADQIRGRVGADVVLASVAVRDVAKARAIDLPAGIVVSDPWAIVRDPDVSVVVEAIGGVDPAHQLILEAFRNGKHVVTANKELVASKGRDLMEAARIAGADLLFEASVAGGVPIIRPMRESLAGDRVRRVMGIVNGTTNLILTRMSELGESFESALSEAARLGFAEADPSADVEGHDAASKVAILATLAFDAAIDARDVQREGITGVTSRDVAQAQELGYEIKLLAVAESVGNAIGARVFPAMLPRTHPLASVRNELNAVFVESEQAGELMFLGRGAGGGPTASAVVGDVVEAAKNVVAGTTTAHVHGTSVHPMLDPTEALARYCLVLSVTDQAGVLAEVASAFARHDVSISSVRQEGLGDEATLVLITHAAPEGDQLATFEELTALPVVKGLRSKIRVVGTPEG